MYRYSQAISLEHKEKGRNVVLSPTINIIRSPLWARAAETFSEDQYLTARLAVESVQGIQSQNVLACPKHLAAYNQDRNRFGDFPQFDAYNSIVDERVMHELYLPAFKAAIQEGKAGSVMCSYNKLNGEYTCQNEWLMGVLKGDWGFTGRECNNHYLIISLLTQVAQMSFRIGISLIEARFLPPLPGLTFPCPEVRW